MLRVLADISRLLNRLRGGTPGKTLCWEEAMKRGHDCRFCVVVGRILRDPWHCYDELDVQDIITRLKRK